jgi:hypothetical protein
VNYLELVQAVHRESASGGTAPPSLTGLRGENLRLSEWVKQADLLIQELYVDWNFRWATSSIALLASNYLYPPLVDIGEFDRDTFRIDGEIVQAVNYLDAKKVERETTEGSPYQVVIMPDGTLRFDPTPAEAATFTFDYWTMPVSLVDADDISVIPERFHLAIVGKALMLYAEYENAPEIMQKGTIMFGEWLNKLQSNQLPGDRYMQNKAEDNVMTMWTE